MIVLPNSFERYLASLRILITRRILKHGQRANHIKNLRKIVIAEALYYKNSHQTVDIKNFCENLLFAIFAHKPHLNFKVNSNTNCIINQNLLSLLIVNICCFSNFLKIESDKNFLYFFFRGKPKNISNIISAVSANVFYETKTEISLLIIPAPRTQEKAIPYKSDWEWLFDEFSIVNLFL